MPSNPTEAEVRALLIKLQDYQRRDEVLHAFEMPEYIALAEAYLRLREAIRIQHGPVWKPGDVETYQKHFDAAKLIQEIVTDEPPTPRKDSPCP